MDEPKIQHLSRVAHLKTGLIDLMSSQQMELRSMRTPQWRIAPALPDLRDRL